MKEAYKKSGVDIDAGNKAVEQIKKHVQKTFHQEVKTGLGGFGGLYALNGEYKKPILVSGTDGVGTKLKIAFELNRHDTVGIDLVAMCVNDILVYGAKPLFLLDYIATGQLDPMQIEEIVKGISDGCIQANCSLIGGETAEMPSMYFNNEYDLAGFAVGIVDEEQIIDGSKISEGDAIVGFTSSGLHSNGYSLVRHLLFQENNYKLSDYLPELESTLGDELIKPTKIYVKSVLEIVEKGSVKGMAHITGGGLLENIPRILPKGIEAEIDSNAWTKPSIFKLLQNIGNVSNQEMYRTFNMGIGFVLIVDREEAEFVIDFANMLGETATLIGNVRKGDRGVVLLGVDNKNE